MWRSQGCWQRPHRLAPKSEPSGGVREVRTVPGERQLSSVAPHACLITRHGAGGTGQELQRLGEAGVLHIPEFTQLPFFSCFSCMFLLGTSGIHWSGRGARDRGRKGKLGWGEYRTARTCGGDFKKMKGPVALGLSVFFLLASLCFPSIPDP